MVVVAKYLCCLIDGDKLDLITYPNPEKDFTALEKVRERAKFLRSQGHNVVYPAMITQIKEFGISKEEQNGS